MQVGMHSWLTSVYKVVASARRVQGASITQDCGQRHVQCPAVSNERWALHVRTVVIADTVDQADKRGKQALFSAKAGGQHDLLLARLTLQWLQGFQCRH